MDGETEYTLVAVLTYAVEARTDRYMPLAFLAEFYGLAVSQR